MVGILMVGCGDKCRVSLVSKEVFVCGVSLLGGKVFVCDKCLKEDKDE